MQHSFLAKKLLLASLFIIGIPIIIMTLLSFFSDTGIFSIEGFSELFMPLRVKELFTITERAFLVCLSSVILSYIVSYLLVFYSSKNIQTIFYILITLPFLVNESVRVFSWQFVLSENGLFNHVLSSLIGRSIGLFNGSNSWNIYFVMLITCMPFGIFINSAALSTIPPIYFKASNDLNLNITNRLIKIAIPLSKFAIITSAIVTFFIAFSLSSEVNFLGGDTKISIRNLVLSLMSASKFQAIFSLGLLIFFPLLMFALVYLFYNRNLNEE